MNRPARALPPILLLLQVAIAEPLAGSWVNSAGTVTVTCDEGSTTIINGQKFRNYNWLINDQPAVWNVRISNC